MSLLQEYWYIGFFALLVVIMFVVIFAASYVQEKKRKKIQSVKKCTLFGFSGGLKLSFLFNFGLSFTLTYI